MTRPTIRYKPGYRPRLKLVKIPTCSDPAAAFHLVRRHELFVLLTGGRAPKRQRVSDAELNWAARHFRAGHSESEYQAAETQAYLAGYRVMAAKLKARREKQST
jgi:hypothetical protein